MDLQEEYYAYRRLEEVRYWNSITRNTLTIFCHHAIMVLKLFKQHNRISAAMYFEYAGSFIRKKASLLKDPIANKQDFISKIKEVKAYGKAVAHFDPAGNIPPPAKMIFTEFKR